jgi:hypothetical protein
MPSALKARRTRDAIEPPVVIAENCDDSQRRTQSGEFVRNRFWRHELSTEDALNNEVTED